MSGSAESRNHEPRGNGAQQTILIRLTARSPEREQEHLCFSVDNDLPYMDARYSPGTEIELRKAFPRADVTPQTKMHDPGAFRFLETGLLPAPYPSRRCEGRK
jgi:hypothetical protein